MKKYQKYALISVYNKRNLKSICENFKKFKIGIISTGSTSKEIIKLGYRCELISDLTKFKEILDGRVKTLHPKIHASLLFNRINDDHKRLFNKLNFPIIDFVIVNLYPFHQSIKKSSNLNKCIEMIDIGGPTLLRSSAKNYQFVTTISDIRDYKVFINNLNKNTGETSLKFRKKLAIKAFSTTSQYDNIIKKWFLNQINKNNDSNIIKLKYGENPNQKSTFEIKDLKNSLFANKIHGKDLGYNNILDIDAGLSCLNEFKEPTSVIIKHNNPCGVASSKKIYEAFNKSINSDPISSFGGIVLLNRVVNKSLALKIIKNFYEIIIAKSFSINAINILKSKKNLILIKTKNLRLQNKNELKSVIGGYLKQEPNNVLITKRSIKCVSNKHANDKQINDLIFAYKVCKHVKSNAIVLVKNSQTVGIGAGQMSRADSTEIAINKNKKIKNKKYFVAASDAFFPFTDNIKKLFKHNCSAIVQPKGSKNDNKVVDFANKVNMPLYFSNFRLFKH